MTNSKPWKIKAVKYVRDEKNAAWKAVMAPITAEMKELQGILAEIASSSAHKDDINAASGPWIP